MSATSVHLKYFSPNNPAIRLNLFFHYSAGICGFHVWRTLADVNNNGVVDIADQVKDAKQILIN